jgi:hypothetical protein
MITNLNEQLRATQNDDKTKHDNRFQFWAKRVTSVDNRSTNGYSFVGDFVRDGTVDAQPGVYLIHTQNGSRNYPVEHYSVLILNDDGTITDSSIYTNSSQGQGWALRIRDQVAALLAEHVGTVNNQFAQIADGELIAELQRRGFTVTK